MEDLESCFLIKKLNKLRNHKDDHYHEWRIPLPRSQSHVFLYVCLFPHMAVQSILASKNERTDNIALIKDRGIDANSRTHQQKNDKIE